jgi:ABC-type transport system involved in cytochrome c biogenesis permease subunit
VPAGGPGVVTVSLSIFVLYALAATAYVVHFARRDTRAGRLASLLLAAGAFAHTFHIGMQTVSVGHVPVAGTTGAISAFVWLLAFVYLYTELTSDERAMGVFIAPLVVALQAIPTFGAAAAPRPTVLDSPLFGVHIVSLLFAYAAFALAGVIGVTYVLLFKEIKAKHVGYFYSRLPSLHVLDTMNLRAVTAGWVCLTLGVVAGGIWVGQARGYAPGDARVQAMSLLDPKIFVALVCWVVYTFQIYARRAMGWAGRRAAWLSAIGFAIVLLNFLPIAYFFTRSHNFR